MNFIMIFPNKIWLMGSVEDIFICIALITLSKLKLQDMHIFYMKLI